MLLGFGWIHLRSSREAYRGAGLHEVERIDNEVDLADKMLFESFRAMMTKVEDPWLSWDLVEGLNNHHGLLTFKVSRNHRTSAVWKMLHWIAENGPGSYGLFYCHDDEDSMNSTREDRNNPMDYDNVFRVHRVLNGRIDELADPFFGPVECDVDPIHPHSRSNHTK